MKTTRYLFLTLLVTLMDMNVGAQQRNVLQVTDVITQIGNVQLPVSIENTDEIVGAQFDLTLPDGVTAESVGTMTNRSDGHSVTVSRISSGAYRVLLHSSQNRPLRGQSGMVMYLPIIIPATFEEGSEHALSIANAVLGKATGENVLTEALAGKIRISKLPDLTVKSITCDKQILNPGDRITISWQVENIGEMATGGGWSEQVSLVNEEGTQSKLIATTHYDDVLNASGIVSRQAEITLPFLLGIDGLARLQVRIVPDSNAGESASSQANNTQVSDNTLSINKMLSVELSPKRIDENAGTRIALRVNRSGQWSKAETFSITTTDDARVTVPSTIVIPANQSGAVVYFTITDNEVLDNDTLVGITVAGNDYPEVITSLIIDDNELPTLSVTASKSDVNECETFQLTITASRVSSQPIAVTLTSENARRFTFPQQVVIPTGETSTTVEVVAVDNDEIELEESIAFQVSADKYERGECIIVLNDNDMPTLTFTLSPKAVSESDGYAALYGVIKRTDNLDKRVTLKLSDDSNGLLTYSNQTVVMAKNQAEVQFNIGVTDNEFVDGNHTVNVTAAVYASSCDCSVTGDSKGSMTTTITIIDDDGPTLKIKPVGTAMLEGSEGNVFTISHNIQSDADIVVRITSDKDDMLEYNHELIIPAGQSSANLLVNVKGNDLQDDSNIATFTVEANGYALGTCWILITDQTLPDAVISLSADKSEAEAEGAVLLRAVVKNVGNASLRSTTPVEISFSGRSEKVKLTVGKTVAVGDSAVIEYNYNLPAITGNHTYEATVNAAGKVPELIYANNTSEKVSISIVSPFSVTAQVDKDIYHQSDSIHISGTATGSAGKNAKIEVYFINEGARQIVTTISDEDGNYSAAWKPLSRQSGHFIVGACYPGSKATEEMDAFDVYGVRTMDNFKTCELSQTESTSGKIILTNPGFLAQTGLTVTPKAESGNCEFTFNAPNSIGAGESIEIGYTVKANEISEGRDWQQMPIEIATAEGSRLDYTIYYYVHSLKARLQANKTSINTTMTHGTPREYPVTIRNVGKAETGKITLALPNWIQTVTPSEMASLAQGDSATILLRFIPTEAMKLNVRVSGHIGINCANGDGTSISFYLTPVSEAKGKLKVDVVDEYTYFTAEAPHVSKAKVSVKNPSTNEVVIEGETADDGTFTAEIPEGYYSVTVDAEKHDSYANTVIVDPGVEKEEEVFLSYQAITYSWNVEETSVEDEYEIETIVKYETRVPKPVVIITLPDEQPEPNSIIPVVITNKGLVNALDFSLSLSVNDGYTLEFLNEQKLDVLAPQQSHVFYAKLVPTGGEEAAARVRKAGRVIRCVYIIARGHYKEPCEKNPDTETTVKEKRWGRCTSTGGNGGGGSNGGGGGYGPSYGPGGWGDIYINEYYIIDYLGDPAKNCSKPNDPNDPNNPYNPDNIVMPPIVPENLPEEVSCDEDKQPVLKYLIVPESGKRYDMRGAATDGMSRLKLVFDEGCKIPLDCNEWTCQWSLVDDNGKIGSLENENAWDGVVYIPPVDYPSNQGSEMTIIARNNVYKNGELEFSVDKAIVLTRVPVVLLHGLHDNEGCWQALKTEVLERDMYADWQVLNWDYHETNCAHFESNMYVPALRIAQVIKQYCSNRILAKQADLIGHSMGGILSRLHIEHVRHDNVHKLITVNTPHSGSPIGDIIKRNMGLTGLILITKSSLGFDIPAIYDLAENSGAIDNLLNSDTLLEKAKDFNIPVHAITTNVLNREEALNQLKKANIFAKATSFVPLIQLYLNLDLDQLLEEVVNMSDMVVPMESQLGGLTGAHTWNYDGDFNTAFHSLSPKSPSVWVQLKKLLRASVDDPMFCKDGFKPKDLTYNAPLFSRQSKHSNIKKANSDGTWSIETHVNGDSLIIDMNGVPSTKKHSLLVEFNDGQVVSADSHFKYAIPKTQVGFIKIYGFVRNGDDVQIDSTFVEITEPKASIVGIRPTQNVYLTVGDTRQIMVICSWDNGEETLVKPEKITSEKKLIKYEGLNLTAIKSGIDTIEITYKGVMCDCPITIFEADEDSQQNDEDESNSICSTVTLSFKQKNVMTRQAFRGTLTVNNENETTAVKNVKMNLEVRDMDGNLTTSHEFQIDAESLNGFEGSLDFTSGWTLGGGETGTATILFIPTKYAAPTEPKDYSFGGSFSYTDPYTGLTVTRDLNPVTLTVNPSPNLEMTYFMQRDVFGDDPLTETVEPMIPSEFALIVNNKGYGDAENMSLTTHQPEIIDNQKGLAISFELISTQLNGGDKNLSLGGSMTSDFGNIPAHSQAYAQWWLQSSLLGHFIEYDVKATHLTSRNNPDLSLLDTVTVHELIHGFTVRKDGDKPLRGFLVNDIKDREDLPDEVYFTDATQQVAYIATNTNVVKQSDTEYVLNVNAGNSGWNYGSLLDPTYGKQKLIKVTRADGTEVNVDNVWQTGCTLRDGKDPLYEKRLHFVGNMSADGETFYLTFEPKPEVELEVERYVGVPNEGTVLKEQLTGLTVKFNKPIKAESFTIEDLTLTCQGVPQDVSQIAIEPLNEQEYKLTLNEATLLDGYYVLAVQTTGIEDNEGFTGSTGKQATWIQFVDGKVALKVTASPVDGGIVTPASGRFDYDSDVPLKAVAAEGYNFTGWMLDGEMVSVNSEYSYHLTADAELTALFTIKHYNVTIDYDSTQGGVEGAATGIYDYGTELQLSAVPIGDYEFDAWMLDGEREENNSIYTLVVNRDMYVNALFKEKVTKGIQSLDSEALQVSIRPLPLRDNMYITGNFKEVHQVSIYDINGIKVLGANDIPSGQAIYVGRLKAGIYYILVATDRGVYRVKVLKR